VKRELNEKQVINDLKGQLVVRLVQLVRLVLSDLKVLKARRELLDLKV
jgi:hypothetical protein